MKIIAKNANRNNVSKVVESTFYKPRTYEEETGLDLRINLTICTSLLNLSSVHKYLASTIIKARRNNIYAIGMSTKNKVAPLVSVNDLSKGTGLFKNIPVENSNIVCPR